MARRRRAFPLQPSRFLVLTNTPNFHEYAENASSVQFASVVSFSLLVRHPVFRTARGRTIEHFANAKTSFRET